MLLILFFFLFNVVDGVSLAKLHDNSVSLGGISLAEMPNSDLFSQIMSAKDNNEALLSILSDADPVKLNEIITLLRDLLATSEAELAGLVASSGDADTAFNNAVDAHNAALVAQQNNLGTLLTTKNNAINTANSNYDQGVAELQAAVDAAKSLVDSTNSSKTTANGVLAADQARLTSEINTLKTVIALLEGVLGINTFSPSSPPTASPTTSSPTATAAPATYDFEGDLNGWTILQECATSSPSFGGSPQIAGQSYAPDNSGHHGSYLLRSQNPGYGNDWTKGILESPQFTICPGETISFLLAGGAYSREIDPNNVNCNSGATQLQLETLVGNVWTKKFSKVPNGAGVRLNQYSWTFDENACATARIRAYDLNAGGWGHVTFDYVRIAV